MNIFYKYVTQLANDAHPLFLLSQTVIIPGPKLEPGQEFEALNYSVPRPEPVQWNK